MTLGAFPSPESAAKYMDAVDQLQRDVSALLRSGGSASERFREPVQAFVFYNAAASAVPPFGVVQITAAEMQKLRGSLPADSYGRNGGYVVNGPQQVAVGDYGIGFRGIVPVYADATTYVTGDRLKAVASSWQATKHPCGQFLVIDSYALRTNTYRFLCVDVGYPATVDFVAPGGGIAAATGTTTITMGSASCDIWDDNGTAGQITDTTFNENIYNKFAEAVPASARGLASLDNSGLWRAVTWSC